MFIHHDSQTHCSVSFALTAVVHFNTSHYNVTAKSDILVRWNSKTFYHYSPLVFPIRSSYDGGGFGWMMMMMRSIVEVKADSAVFILNLIFEFENATSKQVLKTF